MPFNLEITDQSRYYGHACNAWIYGLIHKRAERTEWIRLSAPLVGIATAVVYLATRIAMVAESWIKGLCNIAQGSLRLGFRQSCVEGTERFVYLVFEALAALCKFVGESAIMAWNPSRASTRNLFIADPEFRKKMQWSFFQEQDPAQRNRWFKLIQEALSENLNDPLLWYDYAMCYRNGIGVQVNQALGIASYGRAYELTPHTEEQLLQASPDELALRGQFQFRPIINLIPADHVYGEQLLDRAMISGSELAVIFYIRHLKKEKL